MRLDLLPDATWDRLNREIRPLMGVSAGGAEFEVRCYRGLAPALLETLTATALFLPHKRTVGVVTGQCWAIETVIAHLLRENFQVKTFSVSDLAGPDAILEQLGTDTSCFLWPEDHPVTAERFESSVLEETLNKKRIFSVRTSHHSFRTRPQALPPYSVRLCSISTDLTVAVTGARFKTPAWTAPFESWNVPVEMAKVRVAFAAAAEDEDAIRHFEGNLAAGWVPLLTSDSRLWDRACVAHPEKSGEAVAAELLALLKKERSPPGACELAETLNLCRWDGILSSLDWWQKRPPPDLIRGSIFLAVELLKEPAVEAYFKR